MNKTILKEMRRFEVIFDRLVISLTDTDIAMIDDQYPAIDYLGCKWAEFTFWANQAWSPNIQVSRSYMSYDGEHVCVAISEGSPWTNKSHTTIKSFFNEYVLTANDVCDSESGQPLGSELLLNIPIKTSSL